MKLLALALSIALLFTAGESVTDSPQNKYNLRCCADLLSVLLHRSTIAANLSETQRQLFSLCNRLEEFEKWK